MCINKKNEKRQHPFRKKIRKEGRNYKRHIYIVKFPEKEKGITSATSLLERGKKETEKVTVNKERKGKRDTEKVTVNKERKARERR